LGIAKVCQYDAKYDTDLHVGEESSESELRFASRGDNDRNGCGHAVERGVEKVGGVADKPLPVQVFKNIGFGVRNGHFGLLIFRAVNFFPFFSHSL